MWEGLEWGGYLLAAANAAALAVLIVLLWGWLPGPPSSA
jgi:hypothetical protein